MAFRQLGGTHLQGLAEPLFGKSGRSGNNGDFLLKVYCKNDDSELRVVKWPSGSLSAFTSMQGLADQPFRDSGRSDNNGDFLLKDYCKNDDSELRVLEWPSGRLAALTCRARRTHYLGIPAGAAIMLTSY